MIFSYSAFFLRVIHSTTLYVVKSLSIQTYTNPNRINVSLHPVFPLPYKYVLTSPSSLVRSLTLYSLHLGVCSKRLTKIETPSSNKATGRFPYSIISRQAAQKFSHGDHGGPDDHGHHGGHHGLHDHDVGDP